MNINVAVQTDNGLFVPVIQVSDLALFHALNLLRALFPIIVLSHIYMV